MSAPAGRQFGRMVMDPLARLKAAAETGLPEDVFPRRYLFSVNEVLDANFWPDQGS